MSIIVKYSGNAVIGYDYEGEQTGVVEIASSYNGHTITSISAGAFKGCQMYKIYIPDTIVSIGSNAFNGCSSLLYVYYIYSGDDIKNNNGQIVLDSWANITFGNQYACPFNNGTKKPYLYIFDKNNNEYINTYGGGGDSGYIPCYINTNVSAFAFYNYKGIRELVFGPDVETIGQNAFYYNNRIDKGLRFEKEGRITGLSLESQAFFGCQGLKDVSLPVLTSYGGHVFRDCPNLQTLSVDTDSNSKYFTEGNILYYKQDNDNLTLCQYTNGASPTLILKDIDGVKITKVLSGAFGSTHISEIALENVITIDSYAFASCKSLTGVSLSSELSSIGANAFQSCSKLTSINLGVTDKLKKIDATVFGSCTSLKTIIFPSLLETIGTKAFFGCTSIQEIDLEGCNKLTTVGNGAFSSCSSLQRIVFPKKGITCTKASSSNTYENFLNCPIAYAKIPKNMIPVIPLNSLIEIEITYGTGSIGEEAFKGLEELRYVTISGDISTIGKGAFVDCIHLEELKISKKIKTFDENAFKGNLTLSQIIYLGSADDWVKISFANPDANPAAFATSLYMQNEAEGEPVLVGEVVLKSATSISNYAFYNCSSITKLELPASLTEIKTQSLYNCSSLNWISVSEDNNNFQSIDGVLYSKNGDELIQYPIGNKQTSFVIPYNNETLIKIGENAFLNCQNLISISVPNSLKTVGKKAFEECRNLTTFSVSTPKEKPTNYFLKLNCIEEKAFYNCISLNKIGYLTVLESIGSFAFFGCKVLGEIIFQDGRYNAAEADLDKIPDKASKLKSIGEQSFGECSSLKKIIIPRGVNSMGKKVFLNCNISLNVLIEQTQIPATGWDEEWAIRKEGENIKYYLYSADKPATTDTHWHYTISSGFIISSDSEEDFIVAPRFRVTQEGRVSAKECVFDNATINTGIFNDITVNTGSIGGFVIEDALLKSENGNTMLSGSSYNGYVFWAGVKAGNGDDSTRPFWVTKEGEVGIVNGQLLFSKQVSNGSYYNGLVEVSLGRKNSLTALSISGQGDGDTYKTDFYPNLIYMGSQNSGFHGILSFKKEYADDYSFDERFERYIQVQKTGFGFEITSDEDEKTPIGVLSLGNSNANDIKGAWKIGNNTAATNKMGYRYHNIPGIYCYTYAEYSTTERPYCTNKLAIDNCVLVIGRDKAILARTNSIKDTELKFVKDLRDTTDNLILHEKCTGHGFYEIYGGSANNFVREEVFYDTKVPSDNAFGTHESGDMILGVRWDNNAASVEIGGVTVQGPLFFVSFDCGSYTYGAVVTIFGI